MPDSEPLPDAPQYIQAGAIDMQVFFDRIGMGWLVPYMPEPIPRLVTVSELCALPQPAASPFTLLDVVSMQTGDDAAIAARQKLAAWVDNDLWNTNCRYVDDTPADPPVAQPPPTDLPPVPPPPGGDKMLRDLWYWVGWMVQEFVPRDYQAFNPQTVSGSGTITFDSYHDGEWEVWPAGVKIHVDAKPDWAGQSMSGSPAVYFDLGYFSIGDAGMDGPATRIQRTSQMVYGVTNHVVRFTYNLLPDVTITVLPMYPRTARPIE